MYVMIPYIVQDSSVALQFAGHEERKDISPEPGQNSADTGDISANIMQRRDMKREEFGNDKVCAHGVYAMTTKTTKAMISFLHGKHDKPVTGTQKEKRKRKKVAYRS